MRRGAALPVLETTVVSDWVDYNGHMNDAAYALVFSRSGDRWMEATTNGLYFSKDEGKIWMGGQVLGQTDFQAVRAHGEVR